MRGPGGVWLMRFGVDDVSLFVIVKLITTDSCKSNSVFVGLRVKVTSLFGGTTFFIHCCLLLRSYYRKDSARQKYNTVLCTVWKIILIIEQTCIQILMIGGLSLLLLLTCWIQSRYLQCELKRYYKDFHDDESRLHLTAGCS